MEDKGAEIIIKNYNNLLKLVIIEKSLLASSDYEKMLEVLEQKKVIIDEIDTLKIDLNNLNKSSQKILYELMLQIDYIQKNNLVGLNNIKKDITVKIKSNNNEILINNNYHNPVSEPGKSLFLDKKS